MSTANEKGSLTFANLPRELRDLIWGFAMPTYYAQPQAHFFAFGKIEGSPGITIRWDENPAGASCHTWTRLLPPRRSDGQALGVMDDWAHEENHSAYLAVSGLWNACHESRAVLREHFDRHHIREQRQPHQHYSGKAPDLRAVTAVLEEHPIGQCITTRPGIDLMHISTECLATIDDWPRPFLEYFGHSGLEIEPRHLAVDYDPDWVKQLIPLQKQVEECLYLSREHRWEVDADEPTALHGVVALASDAWHTGIIWLVDHDLHPIAQDDQGVEGMPSPLRRVFYANGRRFVEVTREDVGVRWERKGGEADGAIDETSHDFAVRLDEYVQPNLWNAGDSWQDVMWEGWRYGGSFLVDVKVMACVLD